jgi:gliding motility-associated-like protein
MKYLKTQILSILILLCTYSHAQKEGNIWYFGEHAGLDFNSGTAVPLNDGKLNTLEGCATISDENGDLLFYTNGSVVFNKNHTTMPNATALLGHWSSTQSAIIVKKPESNKIYYIFTVDGATGNKGGLNYSVVDMTLDGGLGDILTNTNLQFIKNIPLIPKTCEKVTAIKHLNGSDFWIISRLENSNTFHSYLLTAIGIDTTPVITNIGPVHNHTTGYMKGSPNGNYIAAANINSGFDLFKFDNTTGVLSNVMSFIKPNKMISVYGLEFSPNSKLLYTSSSGNAGGTIYQYNLLSGSMTDIDNSKIIIANFSKGGAIQLAPDNKIYHVRTNSKSLGAINSPDTVGLGCNYISNAVNLGYVGSCKKGLPSFYSSIFSEKSFKVEHFCYLDATSFTYANNDLSQISWDFGDTASGPNNTCTGDNATHIFSEPGDYIITMHISTNGSLRTMKKQIAILQSPEINIEDSIYLCVNESIILDATNNNASYLWSDNSTEKNNKISYSGEYSISVTGSNGCETSKDFNIIDKECGNNIVYLPTAFSPNNDGINDQLHVRGKNITELELNIFNRFGELVFKTNDISIGWDGFYQGEKLNSEVYITNLNVTFFDGEKKHFYGNITLVL